VIPVYNRGGIVTEAVDSALSQTELPLEIILVNDGSTDRTDEDVRPLLENPKVRYVNQKNQGVSGARNTGIRLASGEFVALLDADDLLAPDALESMASALEEADASWCLTDLTIQGPEGTELQRPTFSNDPLSGILHCDFPRAPLFRREAIIKIGMYTPGIAVREDWELHIRAVRAGLRYAYVDRPLYIYRVLEDGLSRDSCNMLMCTEQVLNLHHKQLAAEGNSGASEAYAEGMWDLGRRWAYGQRDYRKALSCAIECVAHERSLARVARLLAQTFRRGRNA
jgi:glycosyltransferase involved in cell wall biosynthesis